MVDWAFVDGPNKIRVTCRARRFMKLCLGRTSSSSSIGVQKSVLAPPEWPVAFFSQVSQLDVVSGPGDDTRSPVYHTRLNPYAGDGWLFIAIGLKENGNLWAKYEYGADGLSNWKVNNPSPGMDLGRLDFGFRAPAGDFSGLQNGQISDLTFSYEAGSSADKVTSNQEGDWVFDAGQGEQWKDPSTMCQRAV